jgi:hypothetical protein
MRLDPLSRSIPKTQPLTSTTPGSLSGTRNAALTAPLTERDGLALSGSPTGSSSLSDVVARAKAAAAAAPKTEWTMAVNLAASLGDRFGAVSKSQQLKDLAKETEGKPVTFVAQQITVGDNGPMVERFVVKDGKVTSQGVRPSAGFAQDLSDLTSWAAAEHPAKRMGVIIQSHGNAIDGMSGDNGHAELGEIASALQGGLKASGRDKLDLLDFDACLMGQQEVVQAMRGLADHVVASSEIELANDSTLGENVDGQPMREMLRALLADPEMDAAAFAKRTVDLASQAARPFDADKDGVVDPGTTPINATPTLAHFDMAHAGPMAEALDQLGSALSTAMKDPASKRVIEDIIARSPRFSPGVNLDAANRHQRDLKGFSEGLQAAIASGKLADPSGKIQGALQDSLKALDGLVGASFGVESLDLPGGTPQDYSQMGGMGVFLPSAEFVRGTPETLASPLTRLQAHAEDVAKQFAESDAKGDLRPLRDLFVDGSSDELGKVWRALPPERRAEFEPLAEAHERLSQAGPAEFEQAVRAFADVAAQVQAAGVDGPSLEQNKADREAWVNEVFSLAEPHMAEGWKHFVNTLREGGH